MTEGIMLVLRNTGDGRPFTAFVVIAFTKLPQALNFAAVPIVAMKTLV
jgi:hypothetical protein